jgi:hypothetical protein
MNFRGFTRAAAGAALALAVAVPANAQLGALRRAAQAAARAAAPQAAPAQAQTSQPASSRFGDNVLEMTPAVLDRFQAALAAENADRQHSAQQIAAIKSAEQYSQCTMSFLTSPAGQRYTARVSAAADRQDQAALMAAGDSLKAAYGRNCGPDPSERSRMQSDAGRHAAEAGNAAGQFTDRQYPILKERVVPFCRAAATAPASGDVRLPGSGTNVYWVYSAAEAAALRDRCGALMQALNAAS